LENHVFGLRPSYNADVPKLWGAPPGVGELFVFVEGGGSCLRDIFIFNEISAQDKIFILVGTLLGLNILLIT
jgi:hypothetical protein